jgi:DNA-binding LacI/PurR family transcriptional regulator
MKLTTIKDIAKKLGINHATVSRAIHNDPRISEKTREAVLRTVKEMNYTPNLAARGLARGRSNTIAVVTFSYFLQFPVQLMRGIESEMIKTKYDMVYYSTSRYTYIGTADKDAYIYEKILNEKKADAVIVFSGVLYGQKGITERFKKAGIHLVYIEGKDTWGHRIHYDNKAAVEMAVKHLVDRKRKRIGMLIGNTVDVQSFSERKAAFLKSMMDYGIRGAEKNIFEYQENTAEMVKSACNFFMKNKIDGIYCASGDDHSLQLVQETEKLGLKIPEDMAIIGQDDGPVAQAAGLTTIRQPVVEMGKKAVEIAVEAIEKKDIEMRDEVFYPELIVRKTT